MSNSEKKDNLSNSKATPTTFQIFFWKVAGSEISILERCPTDWNKHVGIGMAIFMTTLLAFFSGAYAAYFFTESLLASSAFGVLWAALIYSIDRSLVVTLKKTPEKKWFEYLLPFALRGLLSLIIAFVISIPLELLIFEENISIHMEPYKTKKVQQFKEFRKKVDDIESLKSDKAIISKELGKKEKELTLSEPENDPFYFELKEDSIKKKKKLNELSEDTRNKLKKYNNLPRDENNKIIDNNGKYQLYDKAKDKENTFISLEFKPAVDSLKAYRKSWRKKNYETRIEIESELLSKKGELKNANREVNKRSSNQDSLLQNKKGFVLKFMILEDLASGKTTEDNPEGYIMWVLLWLIRFIFILVELLPTIVKTATPLGCYDLALWAEEQNFAKSLSSGEIEYLEHQTRLRQLEQETLLQQTKDRNTIQEELNKILLKEIAAAQDAVARQKIAEYKEKHLKT
jgi:hypothetical protein